MSDYKCFRKPIQATDGTWWISDLYAASYLHALGHTIVDLAESGQKGRTAFVFEASESFARDYAAFERDEPISVHGFVRSLRAARQLLHSGSGYLSRR